MSEINLKIKETAIKFISESTSMSDFEKRRNTVIEENNGELPDYWCEEIINSGLMSEISENWEEGDE